MKKILEYLLSAAIALAVILPISAFAATQYGAGTLLQIGDVLSRHILNGTILNEDINAAAGIALSKLATDPLARANHTGYQLANTISDLASIIGATTTTFTNKTMDANGSGNVFTNIRDSNISTLAGISATKINPGGWNGLIPFGNTGALATSTGLSFDSARMTLVVGSTTPSLTATSTGSIYASGIVQAGTIEATSTLKLKGIEYTPPSADGSSGYALTTDGAGALSWTSPAASYTASSFTAGHAITAGNAVAVATTTSYLNIFANATSDISANLGNSASNTRFAEDVTESTAYCFNSIALLMKKAASPVDNTIISIQADSAGAPSGTDLVSTTIANSTLTASDLLYRLNFNNTYCSTANVKFWVVYRRSGAIDGTNIPYVGIDSGGTYANGTSYHWDGATWTTVAIGDFAFKLLRLATPGSVVPIEADDEGTWAGFIGFADTTVASSSAVSIITSGVSTDFSGLTAGRQYYLSNTLGGVSLTAGSNSRKVGIAVSTTAMLITNSW